MFKSRLLSVCAALALFAAFTPTLAQERGHFHDHDGGFWGHEHPRGYDWDRWHRGGWINGWHLGRFGWWWVVDGVWFSYPAPVYPYPEPPVVVAAPAPQAPPGNYYYCPNPPGYYPTVQQCLVGWQLIPVTPAAPPAVAAPLPPGPGTPPPPPR